jgi:hypothetical protein
VKLWAADESIPETAQLPAADARVFLEAVPDDIIMAGPEGRGQIMYGDACTVDVKSGNTAGVQEQSPCRPRGAEALELCHWRGGGRRRPQRR